MRLIRPSSRSAATTASRASSAVMPGEALAGRLGHPAVLADHRDLLEPVLAADLEVVRVVAGRDLQRARAELGLDVVVGDDRQPAADERQDRGLPDEPRVALVVGVHRDRGVGEHRLRAHGRDRDRARARTPAGSRRSRACRSTSRSSTSRSEIAEREPGSQLTR